MGSEEPPAEPVAARPPRRPRPSVLTLALVLAAAIAGFAGGAAWRGNAGTPGTTGAGSPAVAPPPAASSGAGSGSGTAAAPGGAVGAGGGPAPSGGPGAAGAAGAVGPVGPVGPGGSPMPLASGVAAASAGASTGDPGRVPNAGDAQYAAPALPVPLAQLDPGLAARAAAQPRVDLAELATFDRLIVAPAGASPLDWRLARPDPSAVRGYAGDVSVSPGDSLALHLAGADASARVDVFRVGLRDAHHVASLAHIPLQRRTDAAPDPLTGRVEDAWPVSATLRIGDGWSPGAYLAKLTGSSGGQSYIVFVVHSPRPQPLMVVLPLMTYEAYNDQGGASLYRWDAGPRARAYEVSFDRPFRQQYGAGQLFAWDFPLLVWLEDHGYAPGYLADVDIARDPQLVEGVQTLVFTGHGEYWTGGMRDAVGARADRGTNLAFFGANQAYWQARLQPDRAGDDARTIVCYKDGTLDPIARVDPTQATTRFDDPVVNRSVPGLMGATYLGVMHAVEPLIVADGLAAFAPGGALNPGDRLPGLVAGEIDTAPPGFDGLLLADTPAVTGTLSAPGSAATTVWINSEGGRIFDAGTFGFAWGLDPRYAASLPGFPADAFSETVGRILAWLGTEPDRMTVGTPAGSPAPAGSPGPTDSPAPSVAPTDSPAPSGSAQPPASGAPVPSATASPSAGGASRPAIVYEVVARRFFTRAGALGLVQFLTGRGLSGFIAEPEHVAGRNVEVERTEGSAGAAQAVVRRLAGLGIVATIERERAGSESRP